MSVLKYLTFFLLMGFLILPILQIKGQSSGLTITSKPYQWTDNMNRLGITTPERGLVLEITIWNNSTMSYPAYYSPYSDGNLLITIEIDTSRQVQPPWNIIEQISISSLYLPPNGSDIRFVKITDGAGINLTLGSYSATLTYGDGLKIEPYPFDFRVMSEEGLQNAINQNPSGTTINIYFPEITIFSSGGVTLLALAIGIRRKKKS